MRNLTELIEDTTLREILRRYENAETPEELEAAKRYQQEVQAAMSKEEQDAYNEKSLSDYRRMLSAMEEDVDELKAESMRRKLGDVPKAVSLTYIASKCGKSKSWLSQRMNGHKVNGKEAHFTSSEAKMVEDALHDLGNMLLKVALI
ncbi:MAG: DUF5053 domain-containing protein [Prevotella sp.]|nr:DUF5053 domain-containing protein [Prevotella sp.]